MSSAREAQLKVKFVSADDQALTVSISDGRKISLPLSWFPRLKHGTPAERNNWRLIGQGEGIHWPALDEDLSLQGLLAGNKSSESQASIKEWLKNRRKSKKAA